jgi:hypothetical protein
MPLFQMAGAFFEKVPLSLKQFLSVVAVNQVITPTTARAKPTVSIGDGDHAWLCEITQLLG